MLTVVHDAQEANDDAGSRRSLLDEIVRDGARQMLAAALRAEVAAYVEQFADQLDEDGRRLVVRNRYRHGREVLTAAGAVTVRAPRVNDRRVDPDTGERQRFSSAILPAWARKSPAWALHWGLRAGPRAIPRVGGPVVGHDDHSADQPVEGRGRGVSAA